MTDSNEYANFQYDVKNFFDEIHFHPSLKNIRGPTQRAEMDVLLKRLTFSTLYFFISKNGKSLPDLFPGKEKYPIVLQDVRETTNETFNDFYKISSSHITDKSEIFKHPGRNCGRKFKIGEPLYRCQECGYDDTCVLCIHCFNPKDHQDHHIYTDICNDFTSGICDCGDSEAWLNELHCKSSEVNTDKDKCDIYMTNESETVVEKFDPKIIKIVLSELFDHFIDLFNQNIEPLPTLSKEITMKIREYVQLEEYDQINELLTNMEFNNSPLSEGNKQNPENYTVMIYNDEYHNYSQATMALRQGMPDNVHTDILTSKVDGEGRAMLKCNESVQNLLEGFFAVQSNGLSATLTSWKEYIHQEVCKYAIQWCNHCLSIPNSDFQNIFRDTLGEVLCEEFNAYSSWRKVEYVVKKYFGNKYDSETDYNHLNLSILDENNKIPICHHHSVDPDHLNEISNGLNKMKVIKDKKYTNSRLQFILYFDNRYWKKLRKNVQNLIIPTLASSLRYKPIFCKQLVEIFNHIFRSITYMDREPQLTALRECIVQLFTCPTNASMIIDSENGYFVDIMWSIIDIFVDFSKFEDANLVWQRVQKSNPTKSFSIAFKQGLYIVETLLSKADNANKIMQPQEFISIVTLCKLFNGAWKIKRKEGEHVLHEDQHFIPYLEYTTSIYSILHTLQNGLLKRNCDIKLIVDGIKLLNTFLSKKLPTYKLINGSQEIIQFRVSKEKVAYMNPIHTLFSLLVEKVSLSDAYEAIAYTDATAHPSELIHDSDLDFDFLKVSDPSLRAIVLCSQIDIGFWVRNGMSVLHQTSYYKNNPELNSYSRDIHLNQLSILWELDDTKRVIYNMLDRWELLEWFNGEVEYSRTVYGDKIGLIIQQFITFVYQLLSERLPFQNFESLEAKKAFYIRNSIAYNLYTKPLSYSKLLRNVPDYLTDDTKIFDEALNEVSIFVEPKGLADNGVFKLKESYFSKIDPLRLLNMGNDFESSAAVIRNHLSKMKKQDISKIVLKPQIIAPKNTDESAVQLGSFTRNLVFVKIIYKLFQISLDTEDSTYLNELLHLIHGIFKDDELVNGKNSLPEAFLTLPICSLLLSVINSKSAVFNEAITTKADYLLENMIMKRSKEVFESLNMSFGEECVTAYKTRKLNQGVNLEETEKERKRRLAKEHQAKILAKFNKVQKKFIKENEEEFDEMDENVDEEGDIDMLKNEKITAGEEFNCSLCQDSTCKDIFVIPAYHEHTPIFRKGSILNPKEFAAKWGAFENDNNHPTISDEACRKSLRLDCKGNANKVFVSCNHHIHYNCFRRYVQKKRFSVYAFICPLCQTYSNCVVPIQKSSLIDDENDSTETEPSKKPFNIDNILKDPIDAKRLTDKLISDVEYQGIDVEGKFEQILKDYTSFDALIRRAKLFHNRDTTYILANHWANTISMLEIASRLESNTEQTFLLGKEQKYKTLRNLFISLLLLVKHFGISKYMDQIYCNGDGHVFSQIQFFQYIMKKFLFEEHTSLETIVGTAIYYFSKQFINDFVRDIQISTINEMYDDASRLGMLYTPQVDLLSQFELLLEEKKPELDELDPNMKNKLNALMFTSLIKNILPTLRRTLIMLKVVNNTMNNNETNEFVIEGIDLSKELSFDNFINMKEDYELVYYFNLLIKILTPFSNFLDLFKSFNAFTQPKPENIDPLLVNIFYETCQPVKLVDLSQYLNKYVTNTNEIKLHEENHTVKNSQNRLDFRICLTCGTKIYQNGSSNIIVKHLNEKCFRSFGIFLIPNTSELCLHLFMPSSKMIINAPYLNSHGESGRNAMRRGDLTVLNLKRYEHINKLWINNEIPGYISRLMGDEFRMNILSNGYIFRFNNGPTWRRNVNGTNLGDDDESDADAFDDDDNIDQQDVQDEDDVVFDLTEQLGRRRRVDVNTDDDSDNDNDRFLGTIDDGEEDDEGFGHEDMDYEGEDDDVGEFDANGIPNGNQAARNFLELFQNMRNVMGDDLNGMNEAPFIQFLNPGFNVPIPNLTTGTGNEEQEEENGRESNDENDDNPIALNAFRTREHGSTSDYSDGNEDSNHDEPTTL